MAFLPAGFSLFISTKSTTQTDCLAVMMNRRDIHPTANGTPDEVQPTVASKASNEDGMSNDGGTNRKRDLHHEAAASSPSITDHHSEPQEFLLAKHNHQQQQRRQQDEVRLTISSEQASLMSSAHLPKTNNKDDLQKQPSLNSQVEVELKRKPIFPEYLMEVLNDDANSDVLRWMPCGTQFTITNYRKFVSEGRMEQLFHIRHMSSFVRKLNRWGFTREFVAGNLDIFRHPSFRRERPDLCRTSMRNVIPAKRKKKAPPPPPPTPPSNTTNANSTIPSQQRLTTTTSHNHSTSEQQQQQQVMVYHHFYATPRVLLSNHSGPHDRRRLSDPRHPPHATGRRYEPHGSGY